MFKLIFLVVLVIAILYCGREIWIYFKSDTHKAEDKLEELHGLSRTLEIHDEIADTTNDLIERKKEVDAKTPKDDSILNKI